MSVFNGTVALGHIKKNISADFVVNNVTEMIYEIGLASQIVNALISILTIVFNGFLLVCMRTHRKNFPEVVRHQLTSLGMSDLISGISPGLWCLCLFNSLNQNARVCSAIHMIFSASQYATLLNLCHLSARRWLVLKHYSRPYFRPKRKIPLVFVLTSLAWFLSLLFHLPALASFTRRLTVNGCVSPELFDYPIGVVYLVPLYVITLLALDIFYLHSLVNIKKSQFKVSPRIANSSNNVHASIQASDRVIHPPDTSVLQEGTTNAGVQRTRLSTHNYYRRQNVQQRSFKQLLVALLVANLATLPYLGIIVCFVLGIVSVQPENVIDMQVLAMNSLLNPLIYGIYLKEVRTAARENVVRMKDKVTDFFQQSASAQRTTIRPINTVLTTYV